MLTFSHKPSLLCSICVARNYLIDKKGIEILKQDTHKFVREIFIESAIREEKIVGESIKQLWGKRKMADYEGSLTVTEGETESLP